ncbi:hypothetical protein [Vibrio chagasii]|uniref:hypothetical protein n=1 Tax=Vibrio chagasii TaxID=170679 RepID=UPI0037353BC7
MDVASLYSLVSKLIKIVTGPLVLIVVSNYFTPDEMTFYFMFFSVLAFKQMAELGIGYTLKQYISHVYRGVNTTDEVREIYEYISFAFLWYIIVAFFIAIVIGFGGYLYLSSYNGYLNWQPAWYLFIFVMFLFTFFFPIQIVLESCQLRSVVYKGKLVYSVVYSISLSLAIYMDAGLYSISISLFISNLCNYITLVPKYKTLIAKVKSKIKNKKNNYRLTFSRVSPLLLRVTIVWGAGYFFWNGFNLIAFKVMPIEEAAKFIFTIACCKVGYSIADSIMQPQLTKFANLISQGEVLKAEAIYSKYRKAALFLLILGYTFVGVIYNNFEIEMFSRFSDYIVYSQISFYYSCVFLLTSKNNFIRAFKVEPFVVMSILDVIFIFGFFYVSIVFSFELCFILSIFWVVISNVYSECVYRDFKKRAAV